MLWIVWYAYDSYWYSYGIHWRNTMITQYDSNGFSIRFDNGYSISVIWNTGSYSDNRSNSLPTSSTVEVGIFPTADGTSKFIRPDYRFEPEESNDVIPFVEVELLAKLIAWTSSLRSVTR